VVKDLMAVGANTLAFINFFFDISYVKSPVDHIADFHHLVVFVFMVELQGSSIVKTAYFTFFT
jgi:hypothetical protein